MGFTRMPSRCALPSMLLLACTGTVLADGKIFAAATSTTPVIIPDQEVMIAYKVGVETMVIRNHFSGQGGEFAWVVPLPSMPTVTETSSGLFPTLDFLCAPRVVTSVANLIPWLIVAFGAAVLMVYRKTTYALLLVILFLFGWLLLPSLYVCRNSGAAAPISTVKIHSRQQIGAYQVATISCDDPNALLTWLKEGQFAVDARSESIIADYVAAKWFFCAVKLARTEGEGSSTSPPLAFQFATDTPVYPLRLTGTHEGGCDVDLYVFGPGRAQLSTGGLETILCSPVEYPQEETRPRLYLRERARVPIAHPKLKELVSGDLVLTRLAGRLSPASMSRDALITWKPFQAFRKSVYGSQAAKQIVWNGAVGIWCMVGLGLVLAVRRKRLSAEKAFACAMLAGALVAAGAMGTCRLWPKVDVHPSWFPVAHNERAHGYIAGYASAKGGMSGSADKLAIARRNVSESLQALAGDKTLSLNNFTGQPRREEDSPGNYGFRVTGDAVEYLWYDEDGREHFIPIKGNPRPRTQPASTGPMLDWGADAGSPATLARIGLAE